jgi:hypothetical protein
MKNLLFVLMFIPAVAHSAFLTGNGLLQRFESTEVTDRLLGLGYVMGVSDAQQGKYHCSGAHVTAGQTRDVVLKYMKDNPQNRDLSADLLVTVSLGIAFPCPKGKGSGV